MKLAVGFLVLVFGGLLALQMRASIEAEKLAPPIGKFVDVEGERMHVVDIPAADNGTAPPVLLIHGASVNLRDMKLALGDALSAHHRVIAVDRPGRGYSTMPAEGWRLDVQARLIHAALQKLGVERPVVVGQSYGGAVALAYTLQYQDDMTGLVLLAPVSHEWPGGIAWYNKVSGWPVAGELLRRLVIPLYGQLSAKTGVSASFAPNTPPDGYYENSGLALLFRPKDFRNNASDLQHLKAEVIAMSPRYGEISVPTAIMTGLNDSTVSRSIHSEPLSRQIPGATLEELPDTGHAVHHARTAEVVATIERVAAGGQ